MAAWPSLSAAQQKDLHFTAVSVAYAGLWQDLEGLLKDELDDMGAPGGAP